MHLIKIFMLVSTIGLGSLQLKSQSLTAENKVLFVYGDFYPEKVSGYDLIVLEGAHFSSDDVLKLKKHNGKVLSYISLGEVNESAAHYPELKDKTLGKNDIWNSYILDIGNRETIDALKAIFEHNLNKGMDGMFLDNIDNYTQFGPTPEKKQELINFLSDIKQKYPEIYLLQNAAVPIVEETSAYIDALAKESVVTNYDFAKKKYELRSNSEFQNILYELKSMNENYDIPVILIEYAEDRNMQNEIQGRLDEINWPVFIGKIDLQTIPERD
ncbi:endo alpha-1,4 polygalactosaminidase [Gramella lutea]|uniref:Endo alpha-1,4 polygalactosaminidase n=1 Tax=Christiangramia lutea TaxID=1607951 RepID=A0A9X1V1Z4_9FLAO|nr:endo alpha-1,4 polygalactosaminidase [Christiangramia lutea]MCH4822907.1 endo alpha-1,4 polygalactosaminidase [Christiangramia lutea]